MKFRWFLLFFTVSNAVSLVSAQEESAISLVERTLLEREQLSWRFLAEKKFEDFARMMGKDFQGVYENRQTNKNQELARLKTRAFNATEFANLKVAFPGPETAIVTSDIKLENTDAAGAIVLERIRCTTVYVKRRFEWVIVLRTHFPKKD